MPSSQSSFPVTFHGLSLAQTGSSAIVPCCRSFFLKNQRLFFQKRALSSAIFAFSLFCAVLTGSSLAWAANGTDITHGAHLDPKAQVGSAYINGFVDIGGQNISHIDIVATSTDFGTKINLPTEGPYALTVDVPEGTSLDYAVSGTAYMDNRSTRMFFKKQLIPVRSGATIPFDFPTASGYVHAEFLATGCQVASSELWAVRDDSGGFSKATTRQGAVDIYRFPVQANSDIEVYGQVQLANGQTQTLTSRKVDILPGAETKVSWELSCASDRLTNISHVADSSPPTDSHTTEEAVRNRTFS